MTEIRPRRSVLYMPGSNARALEKAQTLPADVLILDLEDAVAPSAKAMARDQVVAAVVAQAFGRREVVVRINGLASEWGRDDLVAVAAAGPDAILLPRLPIGTISRSHRTSPKPRVRRPQPGFGQ